MIKIKFTGIIFFIGLCFSCSVDEITQEQETKNLNQLFSDILSMAASKNCTDSSEWTFTSYGNKACGGSLGYMAFPTNIDTELFLEKIEAHRIAQRKYNQKWGVNSDCSIPSQPSGVRCENGHPVFVY